MQSLENAKSFQEKWEETKKHGPDKLSCEFCKQEFPFKRDLVEHLKRPKGGCHIKTEFLITNGRILCDIKFCPKSYLNNKVFLQHVERDHIEDDDGVIDCPHDFRICLNRKGW